MCAHTSASVSPVLKLPTFRLTIALQRFLSIGIGRLIRPERTLELYQKTSYAAATDSGSVGWRTASSAPRPTSRPCAHSPFRDPLPIFRAYRRILLSLRYTTAAGKSDRQSANSATRMIERCTLGVSGLFGYRACITIMVLQSENPARKESSELR